MGKFGDMRGPRQPEQHPTGPIFSDVIKNPEAKAVFDKTMTALLTEVVNAGGKFILASDGADQGLTIEMNGRITRLTPSPISDPEQLAIQQNEVRQIRARDGVTTFDVRVATLRILLIQDCFLKSQNS
jgi:hypothetical protein